MRRIRPNTYRRLLLDWVYRYWAREGRGTPFSMHQLLQGMGYQPNHPKHATVRDWARNYFARSRKEYRAVAEYFFTEPKYKELTEDGLSEGRIWMKVWFTCLEFGWVPVWSDSKDNGLYKPMKGPNYVRLKERRGWAIANEVKNTAEAMEFLFRKFPALPRVYHRPTLESDGIFLSLPPGISCEHCGGEFTDQNDFVAHYTGEHA